MSRLASAFLLITIWTIAACNSAHDDRGATAAIAEVTDRPRTGTGHFGYGGVATQDEINGWNIDIRPDGVGLPPGGATPEDGEMLYEEKCATCHGSFGEGVGRYPVLSGGKGTLTEPQPEKTVGSYWPYASTLWDYIHRAMPFAEPQSLSDDEVYATTAYVLYLNDLIDYDFEVTQQTLPTIEMPNKDGFFVDNRPDVSAVRCMKDCKDPGTIVITSEPEIRTEVDIDTGTPVSAGAEPQGRDVYLTACALCHDSGVANAPVLGDQAGWAERMGAGRDALVASAINGKGTMPPKGGQIQLSDAEIIEVVDYMIDSLEP